jgi:hypothetical protein
MAPARPQRKSLNRPQAWRTLLALALAGLVSPTVPAPAATTERIVVDWHTGLALYGYDPVAYFTDAKPVMGRPEAEYSFAGAIWRFRNEGNRAAFADHADVYMPRYGGYDPIAIVRQVAAPGHPDLWLINHDRLYFFASAASRDAFAADPATAVAAAEARWPSVMAGLVP